MTADLFAPPRRAWIAVACAAHVRRGLAGGFMQVCHGKAGPLRRIAPGDGVAYYSPTVTMGGREPCRAFTAIGQAAQGEPYRVDMGGGFVPWRRDVAWLAGQDAPVAPLIARLAVFGARPNWAAPLRFGLVAISAEDFAAIAAAMSVLGPMPAQACMTGLSALPNAGRGRTA
jgi:hypothetical protein